MLVQRLADQLISVMEATLELLRAQTSEAKLESVLDQVSDHESAALLVVLYVQAEERWVLLLARTLVSPSGKTLDQESAFSLDLERAWNLAVMSVPASALM
jgi:hypothetical protein